MGGPSKGKSSSSGYAKPYTPRAGGTEEGKAANSLTKTFNTLSFDHHLFAYVFVSKAPGKVIRNLFDSMFAIMNVLSQRLDLDATDDYDEYHCAIISKRILDTMAKFEEE